MKIDLRRRLGVAAGMLLAMAIPASAGGCGHIDHDGQGYVICQVDAADEPQLRLWQDGPDGQPLRNFSNLRRTLGTGKTLRFAMNAGMFHDDYRPVGLLVIDGQEYKPIVTAGGGGNFGMLPNGVFCAGGARPFRVLESRAFAQNPPDCRLATQSGPMLVIDGKLHPRFIPGSDSLNYRNGVGVSADGQRAMFVISDDRVNFDTFGRYFRDRLGVDQALYLDGSISRLYAPAIGRNDFGWPLGPIIAVVRPKE